jgi:Secretion system C-terminal sorting domain
VWYFAGTSSGLFSTERLNGANTRWVREGASTLGMADVRMIDVRPNDGFVAVATHGRGLFSSYLPTQTRRYDIATPRLTVGQSFPNPASRADVTIPMFLPRSTRITLTLWNALGQAVTRPLAADMTAGEQFFVMPTSNIPSGIYVYRVETSDGEQAKGMMVIRP